MGSRPQWEYMYRARPVHAAIEGALRKVLSAATFRERYDLPDHAAGEADGNDPLEECHWQDLREAIYDEYERR